MKNRSAYKRLSKLLAILALAIGGIIFVIGLGARESAAAPINPLTAKIQKAVERSGFVEVRKRRKSKKRRRGGATATATASSKRSSIKKGNLSANVLLFGTVETQSTNFKPFKKWKGAMAKTAKEQTDLAAFKKKFGKWVKFLDTLKNKDKLVQIKTVNKFK